MAILEAPHGLVLTGDDLTAFEAQLRRPPRPEAQATIARIKANREARKAQPKV